MQEFYKICLSNLVLKLLPSPSDHVDTAINMMGMLQWILGLSWSCYTIQCHMLHITWSICMKVMSDGSDIVWNCGNKENLRVNWLGKKSVWQSECWCLSEVSLDSHRLVHGGVYHCSTSRTQQWLLHLHAEIIAATSWGICDAHMGERR